jgi:hypothetical protein
MRPAVISMEVGLPHLLVWIAIVGLLAVGYLLYRMWRRRHPKVAQRPASYSERLGHRLAEGRKGQKRGSARSTDKERRRG